MFKSLAFSFMLKTAQKKLYTYPWITICTETYVRPVSPAKFRPANILAKFEAQNSNIMNL